MGGHHLTLGTLEDFITGKTIEDNHDEQYRQKIARLLVHGKGYRKTDIEKDHRFLIVAGEKRAMARADLLVSLYGRYCMLIKYGPGSILTRQRPTLSAARVIAPYTIPVAVATNGEDAAIMDVSAGKVIAMGIAAIPNREELARRVKNLSFDPVPPKQAGMESRILHAFEVDGSCPCDETVCRLSQVDSNDITAMNLP